MKKIKEMFNYRKLWKNQKNKNKRLTKKVNRLKKQVIKTNLEAQRYFDMLMEVLNEKDR